MTCFMEKEARLIFQSALMFLLTTQKLAVASLETRGPEINVFWLLRIAWPRNGLPENSTPRLKVHAAFSGGIQGGILLLS